MAIILKKGTCAALLENAVELPGKHVQVLKVEKVSVAGEPVDPEQFRVVISDGIHSIPVMLATNLNEMAASKMITKFTVLEIEQYLWVEVCTLRIVILEEVLVTAQPSKPLGTPFMLDVSTDPSNVMRSVTTLLAGTGTEERKQFSRRVGEESDGEKEGSDVSTETTMLCSDGAPRTGEAEGVIDVAPDEVYDTEKDAVHVDGA
ncbi:hypothetical protein CALCODRAFT_482807 [Calocera cornea HHB12733]|uniref:Replication factor-A protein 1 N-terminal domain-containing protein n=1 Tax=Calocera cornea HHB12733 TaxID=1353952 RepID=A0A165GA53_9BASI|nr:hypothetical protein CALCODRAFT_482807 [Calocera cornea HHB12733]